MPHVIIDAHTDLVLELVHRKAEPDPFGAFWLPNLQRGGVGLQVVPTYVAGMEALPEMALRRFMEQVQAFHRAARGHADVVVEVRTAEDLAVVAAGKRMGLMLSMEGVEPLGYDPTMMDVFHDLGVRMASLTWNRRNPFADGAAEPGQGGLSRLGHQLIERMLELGMVIDLAHASERTFWDVVDRVGGRAPLVVSHAACRSVYEAPRNLHDEQLRAIAATGGVVGILLVPIFVDPDRWEISRAIDHVAHAVEVMGDAHVGFGGDFMEQIVRALQLVLPPDSLLPASMPADAALEGLAGPQDYPNLVAALRERGFDGDRLDRILGQNFLRVFGQVLSSQG